MPNRIAIGASLTLVLLMGCGSAGDSPKSGDSLKSGLQPGDRCDVFDPLNVTGTFAGKKQCLVWANGGNPVAVIFAREIDAPLTSLVKKIDEATVKNEKSRMGSFVVMLGDDESLEKKLKELADKEKLDKTALTIDNPAGPRSYHIAKDAAVTVLLYVNKTVKVNHTYKKGELNAKAIETILGDLPKILVNWGSRSKHLGAD
jgi:hypothetical protein